MTLPKLKAHRTRSQIHLICSHLSLHDVTPTWLYRHEVLAAPAIWHSQGQQVGHAHAVHGGPQLHGAGGVERGMDCEGLLGLWCMASNAAAKSWNTVLALVLVLVLVDLLGQWS